MVEPVIPIDQTDSKTKMVEATNTMQKRLSVLPTEREGSGIARGHRAAQHQPAFVHRQHDLGVLKSCLALLERGSCRDQAGSAATALTLPRRRSN